MRYIPWNSATDEIFLDKVFSDAPHAKAWIDWVALSDELYPVEQQRADADPEYRALHCNSTGNLKKASHLNFGWKPHPDDLLSEGYTEVFWEDGRGWFGFRGMDVMPIRLPGQSPMDS